MIIMPNNGNIIILLIKIGVNHLGHLTLIEKLLQYL
jgi:hypothetical protein